MSSRRYGHNVNASLIRELRMIAQDFFYTQRSNKNSIFNPKRQAASQPTATLKCSFCLNVRKNKPQDAVTVINGHAACDDHLYYVQGGEHGRILTLIKKDELRETR